MNKLKLLKIINPLLLISFFLQVSTSLMMFFRIRTPYTLMVFNVHTYNGLVMISLAVLHIYLNWGWIKSNFFKTKKS